MTLSLSGFHSSFQQVLDPELDYLLPDSSSILEIELVDFFATKQSETYTAGDKIDFNMRGDGFLRGVEAEFQFVAKVNMTAPATDLASFSRDIDCIINKLKVMDGAGNDLEEIEDYDILARILNDTLPPDYFATNGEIKHGQGVEVDRQSWARNGKRYSIPLISGVLRNPLLYPFAHLGLKIQVQLSSLARATVHASVPAIGYEVSEVKMLLPIVKVSAEYLDDFNQRWSSRGIPYHYTTYDSAESGLLTTQKQTQRISEDISSLKTVYAGFVLEANLSDLSVESQKRDSARQVQYQFKHGSVYIPKQPVITGTDGAAANMRELELEKGVQAFIEFERATKTLSGIAPMNINQDEWYNDGTDRTSSTGEKYVMSMNFDRNISGLVSGTKTKNTPLDVIMKFNANPSTFKMFSYLLHDRIATMSAVGLTVES